MKPLFSVGEEIVIQSRYYPDCNNKEDIVVEVIDTGCLNFPSIWKDPMTSSKLRIRTRFLYRLKYNAIRKGNVVNTQVVASWCESALRKKHKPSDDSFDVMMDKLKNPIKAPQKV